MRRNVYDKLLKWKDDPFRKPLIMQGARQVGKTYILKAFGKAEFKNMVYVNCHNNTFIDTLFAQDFDVQRIVRGLSAYSSKPIVPGETFVFLDEAQDSPNVVASLKYFCEDMGQLHIAVAGSLLGLITHEGESFPVGKVHIMHLYPMTFEEFLGGMHKERLLELLRSGDWTLIDTLRGQYIELLRQYYFVGGMPAPVLIYRETQDLNRVRAEQRDIVESYYDDFTKHTAREAPKIRQVWDSVPMQLSRENKKFIFGAVRKGARAKEFETAIQWLIDAGLTYKVCSISKPTLPLRFYADADTFKLYMLDCGLMGAITSTPPASILVGDNIFVEYKGAFTENYVAQQMAEFTDMPMYYYSKDNSTMEIDFIVQVSDRVLPVEVKAETSVKAKSFFNFINKDFKDLGLKGVRFSMLPYCDQEWMHNVPLYGVSAYMRSIGAE